MFDVGRRVLQVVVFSVIGTLIASPAASIGAEAPPDLGLILNEDGDIVFAIADPDPAVTGDRLRERLGALLETPVRTLVYNVACGSDIMHYPSQAGSNWGWREVEGAKKAPWDKWLPTMKAATANGLDSVRIAGEWAKEHNLYFIPSYRMNDAHYAGDPENSVLTGAFWVEHGAALELGDPPPVPEVPSHRHLLDYSHAAVREHRMAVILEVIDRYRDVMDGVQLDFMRNAVLFPAGTAEARGHLVTDMIRQIRARLDEVAAAEGRPYYLAVRVPTTLRHCRWAGLEVDRWIRDGLVDIVHPSPAMTLSHDIPVAEWVALAAPAGVAVSPALLDRTQFTYPFVASPTPADYAAVTQRDPTEALVRGAVRNYQMQGATGFELYNYNVPFNDSGMATLEALAEPNAGARVYTATPSHWIDPTDTFEPKKAIPAALAAGKGVAIPLYVGEGLGGASADGGARIALRLGLRPAGDIGADDRISIRINGRPFFDGSLAAHLTEVTGKPSRRRSTHPDPPLAYFQVPVDQPDAFRPGENKVQIAVKPAKTGATHTLVELQLAVLPSEQAADAAAR